MPDPVVGILMLKTAFPRPPGDIGNPDTWPFPVRYEVVAPATVARVVNPDPPMDLLEEPFVEAGERLVAAGCAAVTTSCGFLSVFQTSLAGRLGVPVVTSSLMQVPMVQASLAPGRRVGVISVNAGALSPRHLVAAGAPADVPLVGTETGAELTRVIARDLDRLDTAAAEADVLAAGDALVAGWPEVGAVVLECTNMAPYARALEAHLGLAVYDIVSLVNWLYGGLAPRGWGD
jgi:Asp/Glu/hydantoin racemase